MNETLSTFFSQVTEWVSWTTTEWILVGLLVLFCIAQLCFYLGSLRGIARCAKRMEQGKKDVSTDLPPVSVIISANNQREQLENNLRCILEQDYPEFQVVVVDDASTDDTADLLNELTKEYPHLYQTFVPIGVQSISERKIALTVGIKAAKYDHLLFTDANCKPVSNQWIRSMVRHFTTGTEVVLSYSRYETKEVMARHLIAYDNLFTAMRFLGRAALGRPYMGAGQNMAYKKDLFFRQKGFASHLKLKSGEDDLFIASVATRKNTRVEVSADSVMEIQSNDPVFRWRDQRFSRLQTSGYYRFFPKFFIGLEVTTRLLFIGLFLLLLIWGILSANPALWAISAVLFVLRLVVQVCVVNACASVLNETRFYLSLPLFDLILPFYTLIQRLENLFVRRKSRNRQVLH